MNKSLTISCACVIFVFVVAIALFIFLMVSGAEKFKFVKSTKPKELDELDDIASIDPRHRGRRNS